MSICKQPSLNACTILTGSLFEGDEVTKATIYFENMLLIMSDFLE
jgi:hypothetical protein